MEYLFSTYPLGTIRFFRKVIVFGFVTGLLMFVPVLFFIRSSWDSYCLCDRILRAYHLIRFAMWLCQLPLRVFMLRRLTYAKGLPTREAVVNDLLQLVACRSWRANQATGIVSYFFFAFALVFSLAGSHCSATSLWLYRFLVVNLLIFMMHMACSCLWLRQIMSEDAWEAAMWRRGLDENKINAICKTIVMPAVDYSSYTTNASSDGSQVPNPLTVDGFTFNGLDCNICFSDYSSGQRVRVLPCSHHYHSACVDLWLSKKKNCPTCMCDIDHTYEKNLQKQQQQLLRQRQVPKAGDAENDRVIGAALLHMPTHVAMTNDTPTASSAASASAAASTPAASSSSSSSTATAATTTPSEDEVNAANSLLLSGLRTRRANGSIVYSSNSAIETPPLQQLSTSRPKSTSPPAICSSSSSSSSAAAADTVASSEGAESMLTHKGVPVLRATAPAPLTASGASSSSSASALSASRAPYAAARVAALEQWRAELDQWAEDSEGEALPRPDDGEADASGVAQSTAATAATPAAAATSSTNPSAASASTSSAAPPSAPSNDDVERLMEQWKLEEEMALAHPDDDEDGDEEDDA